MIDYIVKFYLLSGAAVMIAGPLITIACYIRKSRKLIASLNESLNVIDFIKDVVVALLPVINTLTAFSMLSVFVSILTANKEQLKEIEDNFK